MLRSADSKNVLATCCVIVLPPWRTVVEALVLVERVVLGRDECLHDVLGHLLDRHHDAALASERTDARSVHCLDIGDEVGAVVAERVDLGQVAQDERVEQGRGEHRPATRERDQGQRDLERTFQLVFLVGVSRGSRRLAHAPLTINCESV